jgi:hypothetical protein
LFDLLGIKHTYEPEKFMLPHGEAYIPDFFLPDHGYRDEGAYFEVKGPDPSHDDLHRCCQLSHVTQCQVLLFSGGNFDNGHSCHGAFGEYSHSQYIFLTQCPFCGGFGFNTIKSPTCQQDIYQYGHPHIYTHSCEESNRIARKYDIDICFMDYVDDKNDPPMPWSHHSPVLDIAYDAARSARFEDPLFESHLEIYQNCINRLMDGHAFGPRDLYESVIEHAVKLSVDPHCPDFNGNRKLVVG